MTQVVSGADSVPRPPLMLQSAATAGAKPAAGEAKPSPALDLRTLFHSHYSRVWRALRRFGVPASRVDDAAQEVFWVTARRLGDIVPGKERSFLYGVALRIASNHARRERAALPWSEVDDLAFIRDERPSPEAALEQRQARQLLDAVLDRMDPELRRVFVLFELEGLPVRDIAELEGIPLGTASSRLRRARDEFSSITSRLRAVLESRQGTSKWR
jgi:RNA polymerase sigma-70 factor (ECF subfamily)